MSASSDASALRRWEILFIYDIADANPNGDPNDENRPRMDPDTGRAKVSDVRIKRTIRDYLHDVKGEEILCRQTENEDGSIKTGKQRAEDFFRDKKATKILEKRDSIQDTLKNECIDVRLFGATLPVAAVGSKKEGSSVTLTGPVQFAMGSTLHRVTPVFVKGTGAFASSEGAQKQTFREEWMLPYAVIAVYGIVNENAASSTGMTKRDAEKLLDALWFGTKNLITRSKIGQRPLFMIIVEYSQPNAYIGRIDRLLSIKKSDASMRDEQLRDVTEIQLVLSALKDRLHSKRADIALLKYAWDERLKLDEKPIDGKFLGFDAQELFA